MGENAPDYVKQLNNSGYSSELTTVAISLFKDL